MGIMMVTSISAYAQNMKMAVRWQERQEKSDYTPDKPEFVDKSFQNNVEEKEPLPKRSSQMETDIEIKLNAGKKLSAEEMAYLKAYDPSAYQKAKTILQERKAYEKALESCQTKDEVEELKAKYAEAAVERIRMIRNTPGLSSGKKRELLKMEHMRAAALDDAMHEFTDSPEYKRLPAGTKIQEGGEGTEGKEKSGFGLLESLQEKKAGQGKEAEKAAEYEVGKEETDREKKYSAVEVSADDAAEEGSIMRAILDEEARWAREDEENASLSREPGTGQGEETPGSYLINQAKAAYFASQVYTSYPDAAMVDVKK